MALKGKEHVKVEFQNSDSGSEGDLDESDSFSEDKASDAEDNDSSLHPGNTKPKTGLADVMTKILQKKIPKHQQIILAKGKTEREIRKRKLEKDEEAEDSKSTTKHSESDVQYGANEQRRLWEDMCRVKPDPLDREKERRLQRIGTRGVVQLFNAVRKQQKIIGEKIEQVGSSIRKQDKVMEGVTKEKFLDILKGSNVKTEPVEKVSKAKVSMQTSNEDKEEDNDSKKWSILRDDFMMGAKMKDWNKESSDEEEEQEEGEGPDMSDSD